jgi:hypothetical protein
MSCRYRGVLSIYMLNECDCWRLFPLVSSCFQLVPLAYDSAKTLSIFSLTHPVLSWRLALGNRLFKASLVCRFVLLYQLHRTTKEWDTYTLIKSCWAKYFLKTVNTSASDGSGSSLGSGGATFCSGLAVVAKEKVDILGLGMPEPGPAIPARFDMTVFLGAPIPG